MCLAGQVWHRREPRFCPGRGNRKGRMSATCLVRADSPLEGQVVLVSRLRRAVRQGSPCTVVFCRRQGSGVACNVQRGSAHRSGLTAAGLGRLGGSDAATRLSLCFPHCGRWHARRALLGNARQGGLRECKWQVSNLLRLMQSWSTGGWR